MTILPTMYSKFSKIDLNRNSKKRKEISEVVVVDAPKNATAPLLRVFKNFSPEQSEPILFSYMIVFHCVKSRHNLEVV